MGNYARMAREANRRRKALRKDLARAEKAVDEVRHELAIVDGILVAIRGGEARGAGKAGGKWRPGRPGRPPKWWVEQQKRKGARKAKRGRRARRRGRKAAAAPAAQPAG